MGLTPLRLNFCSLVSVNNLPKSTTPHLTPLTPLETLVSYLVNTSPLLTRSHPSPNPAIIIFVSFTISIHTLIPKQLPPLPLPSLTTATLYHNIPKSQITRLQQIQNCPAHAVVKAPKCSHITPILWSLHLLKITECIKYKLLSLIYKVLTTTQPSYLHKLITVQPPRSTCSSSLVTLAHLSPSSSLHITDRSCQYASPCLWNQRPASFCQPRINLYNSDSPSVMNGTSSISSIDSPLSSFIIPSLFHSSKTFLFCKSFSL